MPDGGAFVVFPMKPASYFRIFIKMRIRKSCQVFSRIVLSNCSYTAFSENLSSYILREHAPIFLTYLSSMDNSRLIFKAASTGSPVPHK